MFKSSSPIVASAILLWSVSVFATTRIGINCNDTYQIDPKTGLPWLNDSYGCTFAAWNFMAYFTMHPRNTSITWYSDMASAHWEAFYWEMSGDTVPCPGSCATAGIDTVDLYFAVTHAGSDHFLGPHQVNWASWEKEFWASSIYMQLGDAPGRLSIFSTVSCDTMVLDSFMGERWNGLFSGGLRYASGSHGNMISDSCIGTNYAAYLVAGRTLADSWLSGTTCANANPAVVLSAGANRSDCYARAANMTLYNYDTYLIYRGSQIASLCGYYVN
jgi:hypothetical protein